MESPFLAFFRTIGMPELLIILVVLLLLFGAKKLPQLARGIGKSLSEFRRGRQEGDEVEDIDKKGPPKSDT